MSLFRRVSLQSILKSSVRAIGAILCISFILLGTSSCSEANEEDTVIPADYGTYGAGLAEEIVTRFPYRKAYTQGEKSTGEYIRDTFKSLGYTVEEQTFSSIVGIGTSTNYIIRIDGEGFMIPDGSGIYRSVDKQVIVGAHYDTIYGSQDAATYPTFNGIQDNAAGIASLLTLAKEIKGKSFGYDVVLVAFGAGNDFYAGANYFVSQMSDQELTATDAMYCVESIYAGDKLYANAGMNSLDEKMKYSMRRKLYEAYDVVYESQLSSLYGVDLLYNQCGQTTDLDGDNNLEIYREVTLTLSDYVPFDRAGIPIVFFESYDYNFPTIEEMKETKNLDLQENGGLIRRTNYDSYNTLVGSLPERQLEKRINATAFIILSAIEKGNHAGIKKSEYVEGITVAPTPSVTTDSSQA
jgi:alkaline phosphatase isozyme conversion protein